MYPLSKLSTLLYAAHLVQYLPLSPFYQSSLCSPTHSRTAFILEVSPMDFLHPVHAHYETMHSYGEATGGLHVYSSPQKLMWWQQKKTVWWFLMKLTALEKTQCIKYVFSVHITATHLCELTPQETRQFALSLYWDCARQGLQVYPKANHVGLIVCEVSG